MDERPLARDVEPEPVAEHAAVAEPRVDRVLEMRVRVDEARKDQRVVVVALGAARGDLDDAPVFPGDVSVLQWRAVDREHPVGGDGRHVSTAVPLVRIRALLRSRRTESQIEHSNRITSGSVSKKTVTGSTPGSATARQTTRK